MKRLLIILALALVDFSATAQKLDKQLKPFSALLGKWKMPAKKGVIIEEWQWRDPSGLQGKSYSINAGDTTLLEIITINAEGNEVVYISTVPNQNDGKPVKFKLISSEAGKWVFENKQHDFPQQIVYWLKGKDELSAWIEGTKNGRYSKSEFAYKRIE